MHCCRFDSPPISATGIHPAKLFAGNLNTSSFQCQKLCMHLLSVMIVEKNRYPSVMERRLKVNTVQHVPGYVPATRSRAHLIRRGRRGGRARRRPRQGCGRYGVRGPVHQQAPRPRRPLRHDARAASDDRRNLSAGEVGGRRLEGRKGLRKGEREGKGRWRGEVKGERALGGW
jgi:hypothetical protein